MRRVDSTKFRVYRCLIKGQFYTRAKSYDHEIVRAQKKVSKGRPESSPKLYSVVTDPKLQCEVICNRTLNQIMFQ